MTARNEISLDTRRRILEWCHRRSAVAAIEDCATAENRCVICYGQLDDYYQELDDEAHALLRVIQSEITG